MLIDTTLREGAQAYGVYFAPNTRRRMAGLADRLGRPLTDTELLGVL